MKDCKVCGKETKTVYNIDLKATPICEQCGRAIALQEITWMFDILPDLLTSQKKPE